MTYVLGTCQTKCSGFRVPCLANHSVFIKIINLTKKQISVGWGLVNSESVLGGVLSIIASEKMFMSGV